VDKRLKAAGFRKIREVSCRTRRRGGIIRK
jgi:hypothetical protein